MLPWDFLFHNKLLQEPDHRFTTCTYNVCNAHQTNEKVCVKSTHTRKRHSGSMFTAAHFVTVFVVKYVHWNVRACVRACVPACVNVISSGLLQFIAIKTFHNFRFSVRYFMNLVPGVHVCKNNNDIIFSKLKEHMILRLFISKCAFYLIRTACISLPYCII